MKPILFTTFLASLSAALLLGLLAAPARADILYVADHGYERIEKITSDGVGTTFAPIGTGVAFDTAGNLYVSLGNNTIVKYTPSGSGTVFASTGLNVPFTLAFDSTGNLYAANEGNSTIEKYSPTGSDLGVFASTGLSNPTGLAFDSAGNLFAANYSNGTIEKFSPSGIDLGVFAATGTPQIQGLAFDAAGNLFVANDWSYSIDEFTPEGVESVFASISTGLKNPFGLAFDSAGNLYAANEEGGGAGIVKFTPGGVASAFSNAVLHPYFIAFTDDNGVPLPLANQVPEPSTWAMLGLGLPAALAFRRRRSA